MNAPRMLVSDNHLESAGGVDIEDGVKQEPLLPPTTTTPTANAAVPLIAPGNPRCLWLMLLGAEVLLNLITTILFRHLEGWSVAKSLYVSISVGFGEGIPYKMREVSALCAAGAALCGTALLAVSASLLVRQIVLRQQEVREEVRLEVMSEIMKSRPTVDSAARVPGGISERSSQSTEQETPRTPLQDESASIGRIVRRWSSQLVRQLSRAARDKLASKRGKRGLLLVAWSGCWGLGFYTFANDKLASVIGPNEHRDGPVVYGLLWVISCMTTSSLGSITPRDNAGSFVWASLFIAFAVPLNAAIWATLIDLYISHFERREARRQLMEEAVPGRDTFLAMAGPRQAAGPSTNTISKVTWGTFLEYRMRQLEGTVIHAKLLDQLKAAFDALDGEARGYVEWADIDAAELTRSQSEGGALHPPPSLPRDWDSGRASSSNRGALTHNFSMPGSVPAA
jgi:hypothetical protein